MSSTTVVPSTDIKGNCRVLGTERKQGLEALVYEVHCVAHGSLELVTFPPKRWGRRPGWRTQHTAFLKVIKS